MKAYLLQEAGATDNLKLTDVNKPEISPNEVLVQVKAIAINPVDVKARAAEGVLTWACGEKRPVILGWDISGIVASVGSEVKNFKVGDEVFGMINFLGEGKAYAEYVAAPYTHLTKKPSNISFEEAAGATLAALTTWQVLVTTAKIKSGDRVLVHGASGGVGHYAVQIAKHFGAYVIGTSSAPNKDFVLDLGADEHIDYKSQKFEEVANNIDIVLNTVPGDNVERSLEVMKDGGIIVSITGFKISEEKEELKKSQNIHVEQILVNSNGEDMNHLAELLEKSIIKSIVHETYTFTNLPNAHARLEKGNVQGKIVIAL